MGGAASDAADSIGRSLCIFLVENPRQQTKKKKGEKEQGRTGKAGKGRW
jgi:hypothetical protein